MQQMGPSLFKENAAMFFLADLFHFVCANLKEKQGTGWTAPPTEYVLSLDGFKLWEWEVRSSGLGVYVSNLWKKCLSLPNLFFFCSACAPSWVLIAGDLSYPSLSFLHTVQK